MKALPYVIISTAMSLDGYIDDATPERLRLSNEKDLDRVDELRASCDAILIGANTIRKDNPKLLLKSPERQKERVQKGLPANPTKITITVSGDIDTDSRFFTTGDEQKIIYTISTYVDELGKKLPNVQIISGGEKEIDLRFILEDMYERGIKRLMVEGGSSILSQFLQEGYVNEIQLAIAGFFVGQKDAPRFVQPGNFPWNKDHRLHLDSVKTLDDIAVLIYKV